VQSDPRPPELLATLERLAGALAGVAALVYLTGGLALQLRLGTIRLPSSAAVPQLPREFLISYGLLIVAPAIGVALLAGWAARRLRRSSAAAMLVAVGAGAACYLAIGLLVVTKDPFPARVCLLNGGDRRRRVHRRDEQPHVPRRPCRRAPEAHRLDPAVAGRSRARGRPRAGSRNGALPELIRAWSPAGGPLST
jgi:hypothetical protein